MVMGHAPLSLPLEILAFVVNGRHAGDGGGDGDGDGDWRGASWGDECLGGNITTHSHNEDEDEYGMDGVDGKVRHGEGEGEGREGGG